MWMLIIIGQFLKKKSKDLEGAIIDYEKCISVDDNFELPYNNLGLLLANNYKYNKAIPYLTKALLLNPDLVSGHSYRGFAYMHTDDYLFAIKDFTTAIQLKPSDPFNYFNRGISWGFLKNYIEEIKDYEKTIELNPNHMDAFHNLAIAYGESGDQQKSIENFIKAAQLGHISAQNYLSKIKIVW